jgi:hypothetical protein
LILKQKPLQNQKKNEAAAAPRAAGQLLDNFIKVDWAPAKDNSSEVKLSQVAGPGGSALRISYDLKNGKWIAVSKGFAIDDFKARPFPFKSSRKEPTTTWK